VPTLSSTPRRECAIHRHTWKWALAVAAAVALLLWFLYTRFFVQGFDWAVFAASFSHLRWPWLALSLVPIFGTYFGRALRWAVFLKPLKPHASLSNLLIATIIGFTAIALFGRPGEFIRPYLIAVKERVPIPSQLAAWVLERIFDLLMALLVFGFALSRVQASGVQVGSRLAWVLSWGGWAIAWLSLAILMAIVLMRHVAEPLERWLMRLARFLPEAQFQRIGKLVSGFVQGVESTRSDAALLAIFLYSALEWLLIAACYWCVARAFAGTLALSLVDVLIFMGFVSFGAIVQIPGVGGGMQVVSVLVLTELFGVRFELATSFALFIWILTFVVIVPFGLVLALKEGLNWHSLRQIGREASSG
jgi:hypothetical protein